MLPDSMDSVEAEYQRRLLALEGIRRSSADLMASRRRLEAQADDARRAIERLQAQATSAAAQNQDDLARAALRQALEAERRLVKRQTVVDGLRSKERELAESSAKLQAGLADYRVRREAAQVRSSAADASHRAAEAESRPDSAASKPSGPNGGA
jgi:phage shock protein A